MRVVHNDISFDSNLECNNYKLLEKLGATFSYNSENCMFNYNKRLKEGVCFTCGSDDVASKHLYTTDFEIVTNGTGKKIYVETKGAGYCWQPETRTKHLILKKEFPDMDLRFVFSNWNAKIKRGSKTSSREWCERYGFICADKWIPKGWLDE